MSFNSHWICFLWWREFRKTQLLGRQSFPRCAGRYSTRCAGGCFSRCAREGLIASGSNAQTAGWPRGSWWSSLWATLQHAFTVCHIWRGCFGRSSVCEGWTPGFLRELPSRRHGFRRFGQSASNGLGCYNRRGWHDATSFGRRRGWRLRLRHLTVAL